MSFRGCIVDLLIVQNQSFSVSFSNRAEAPVYLGRISCTYSRIHFFSNLDVLMCVGSLYGYVAIVNCHPNVLHMSTHYLKQSSHVAVVFDHQKLMVGICWNTFTPVNLS